MVNSDSGNSAKKQVVNTNLLVVLHLYYLEQISFFIEKLENINNCNWQLILTSPFDLNHEILNNFKRINKNVIFFKVPNIGYDIWPFIFAIKHSDLSKFDFVIKLQTKRPTNRIKILRIFVKNYGWRNELVNALLLSKTYFNKIIRCLIKHDEIGIIGSKSVLRSLEKNYILSINQELDKLHIVSSLSRNRRPLFFAGTMFIIRAKLLAYLYEAQINEHLFKNDALESESDGTISHIFERLFSIVPQVLGYKIKGKSPHPLSYYMRLIQKLPYHFYYKFKNNFVSKNH